MQDDNFELIAELDHFRRMLDPLPGHIGNVEQSIDSVDI
jgi:hypothetical protein